MISIKKCPCGHPNCSDYHLIGIGNFCQGSGFDFEEATLIAELLNGQVEEDEENESD